MNDEITRVLEDLASIRKSIGELRLDIELSKKDISGLQKIYEKTEKLMQEYDKSFNRLNRVLDLQEANSKTFKDSFIQKADNLESSLDDVVSQVLENQEERAKTIEDSISDIQGRTNILERNQWRFAGLAVALVIAISLFIERTEVFKLIGSLVKG